MKNLSNYDTKVEIRDGLFFASKRGQIGDVICQSMKKIYEFFGQNSKVIIDLEFGVSPISRTPLPMISNTRRIFYEWNEHEES